MFTSSKEMRFALVSEYITAHVPEKYADALLGIAQAALNDMSFLFDVYSAYVHNESFVRDDATDMYFERDADVYVLGIGKYEYVALKDEFRKTLVALLDLLEDTLPLGSVVELKKDVFTQLKEISDIEYIRLVITHRFLGIPETKYYLPYAGTVYPTGMLGETKKLHFSGKLISRVLHFGFLDESEIDFIYLMKKDLVIDKQMSSIGWASDDEAYRWTQEYVQTSKANRR